jgi:hypothetical protein
MTESLETSCKAQGVVEKLRDAPAIRLWELRSTRRNIAVVAVGRRRDGLERRSVTLGYHMLAGATTGNSRVMEQDSPLLRVGMG